MRVPYGPVRGLACALVVVTLASAVSAGSIEDQISVYSEKNAMGYLEPLVEVSGTDLNMGMFDSALIPPQKLYFRFELVMMGTWFADDDETFKATTEEGFTPEATADASTVVGPGEAFEVEGDAGSIFIFPGGFDLSSLTLGTPQIRFGGFKGTEVLLRGVGGVIGDNELGDISLMGFGVRHSISQYFPNATWNAAGGFMWTRLKAGKNKAGNDMFKTTAWTLGAEGSKIYTKGPATFEPYLGLSLDYESSEVQYESEASDNGTLTDLNFDASYAVRLSVGLLLHFKYVAGKAEFNLGKRRGVVFALGFGQYF
jgi:hypothetical protein